MKRARQAMEAKLAKMKADDAAQLKAFEDSKAERLRKQEKSKDDQKFNFWNKYDLFF